MSAIANSAARPVAPPSPIELWRDDGPLERILGMLGARLRLPPILLIAAGATPLMAGLIAEGDDAQKPAVGVLIGCYVLLAGLSSGRPHDDRMRWAVPAALRLVEYTTLLWLGVLAGQSSEPAAFALICALAFRHYDLVYRVRHQGTPTPRWVGDLALGWGGRMIGGWLLWVAGALPAGFFVAAGVYGALFVAESVESWQRWSRRQDTTAPDDDAGEGEDED